LQFGSIGGGPRFTEISRLNVVKVRAPIDAAAGMAIEECPNFSAGFVKAADLVMALQAGQFLVVAPIHAIRTSFPKEFAPFGVFGEEMEKSLPCDEPRLRVGEFLLGDQFEFGDIIGPHAAVFET